MGHGTFHYGLLVNLRSVSDCLCDLKSIIFKLSESRRLSFVL